MKLTISNVTPVDISAEPFINEDGVEISRRKALSAPLIKAELDAMAPDSYRPTGFNFVFGIDGEGKYYCNCDLRLTVRSSEPYFMLGKMDAVDDEPYDEDTFVFIEEARGNDNAFSVLEIDLVGRDHYLKLLAHREDGTDKLIVDNIDTDLDRAVRIAISCDVYDPMVRLSIDSWF